MTARLTRRLTCGLGCVCCACLGLAFPVQAREAATRRPGAHAIHRHIHSTPSQKHRARTGRKGRARRPARHGARHAGTSTQGFRRIVECGFDGSRMTPALLTSSIFAGPRDGSLSPLAISFGHVPLEHPASIVQAGATIARSGTAVDRPAEAVARAAAADVQPPASSDVDFIGLVEAEHHDLKVAVLRVGHRVVYGRAGDLLAGRYRLLRFSEEAAQVFDVNTAATRTLAMGTP